MPRDAFVLKIQRELWRPKYARNVSELSRNGPQESQLPFIGNDGTLQTLILVMGQWGSVQAQLTSVGLVSSLISHIGNWVHCQEEPRTSNPHVLTFDKLLHHVRTLMISVCSSGKIVFGWLRFSKFSKQLLTWNCWKCCWITYRLIATFPRNYRVFNLKWLKKYFSGKLQTFNP